MILRLCRRVLGDEHEAQDAAQSVFLILARRAGSIRRRESAAGWLYRVARRTATRARVASTRRREVSWRDVPVARLADAPEDRGASCVELYEELDRLPERYRAPLVLCCLEGLTCEEAAHRLRCASRTVETRLYRGRARLRQRLIRRGVVASLALAAAAREATAAPPASWTRATIRASAAFSSNPSAAVGLASATALELAQGALKTMSFKHAIATASTLVALGGLTVGVLWAQGDAQGAKKPVRRGDSPAAKPAPKKTEPKKTESKELALDDGKAAGKRSIAGSGHAVRFEAPDDASALVQVKVHGARYGLPRAPREDFVVFLCDDKYHKLAEFPFRYGNFERGEARWVTLDVKKTKLPKTFYLGVDFDPTQTKGVYVDHDGKSSERSVIGLPDEKPEPFTKGNWMIRAIVKPSD
jgi:RNA polymerase sigma-70 factor (ECF subfamily)